MPSVTGAAPQSVGEIASRVDDRLAALLAGEQTRWGAVAEPLVDPLAVLAAFVANGGKRLRPAFCFWSFVGAGGHPEDPEVIEACAALELLHAFALVHDDVMDGSPLRRGADTVHVTFAQRHDRRGWHGEGRRFGEGMAVLVGDLAITYADALLSRSAPEVVAVYGELKLEMVMGQCLDMLGAARRGLDVAEARQVALLKTAKYTVERPLHLGAALARRLDDLAGPLTAFGVPLGEAFQLRDDVLGAFGDEATTGKPVGEDFREGKPTVLLAVTHERLRRAGDAAGLAVLHEVGHPDLDEDGVAAIRDVVESSGARAEVEALITTLVEQGCGALATTSLEPSARAALDELARFVAGRAA